MGMIDISPRGEILQDSRQHRSSWIHRIAQIGGHGDGDVLTDALEAGVLSLAIVGLPTTRTTCGDQALHSRFGRSRVQRTDQSTSAVGGVDTSISQLLEGALPNYRIEQQDHQDDHNDDQSNERNHNCWMHLF